MTLKRRLSASVDADLLRAAEAAAKRGDAATLSAWVNEALREKLEHERRLQALGAFVREFEAEHGEITEQELEQVTRKVRARTVSVRTLAPVRAKRARGRAG